MGEKRCTAWFKGSGCYEELGLRFIDRTSVEGDWEGVDLPGEEDVMRIAGQWSLNPQEIDAYPSRGAGYLGDQP